MDRRTFLATAVTSIAAGKRAFAAPARVKSDADALRRVLVHRPCAAAWWPIPDEDAARAILFDDERYTEEAAQQMWAEGLAHHRKLVELLRAAEVEVLF
ncbi:MAG: hypothetical protein P4L84_17275, partial [Isosphaeraceae bacterium]|nr:hypothetical protein [Isosphaeraceae bacterium]